MNWKLLFARDTRHLRILAALIIVGGVGAVLLRNHFVPASYGQHGPYRGAALQEIATRPSVLQTDATCLKCHENVQEERAESPHGAVRCTHCHGIGRNHVAQARQAAESPDHPIAPAEEWDGDFLTQIDLFITHDRAICLSCHEAVVGMPTDFRSINVAAHLEDQGAEEPKSRNVCFECHEGHSPGL